MQISKIKRIPKQVLLFFFVSTLFLACQPAQEEEQTQHISVQEDLKYEKYVVEVQNDMRSQIGSVLKNITLLVDTQSFVNQVLPLTSVFEEGIRKNDCEPLTHKDSVLYANLVGLNSSYPKLIHEDYANLFRIYSGNPGEDQLLKADSIIKGIVTTDSILLSRVNSYLPDDMQINKL